MSEKKMDTVEICFDDAARKRIEELADKNLPMMMIMQVMQAVGMSKDHFTEMLDRAMDLAWDKAMQEYLSEVTGKDVCEIHSMVPKHVMDEIMSGVTKQ